MSIETMQIISTVIKIAIPVVIFFVIVRVNWAARGEEFSEKTKLRITGQLKNARSGNYFNFDRINDMLHRKGVYYMFDGGITPVTFLLLKFAIAVFVILVALSLAGTSLAGILISLAAGVAGFFVLDLLIHVSNESDNEDMLMDIKKVFDTLKIQTKGSVHLSNALLECYLVVSNRRLKKEMQKMSSYILATNDVTTAVTNFNRQFENQYIDSLCMTLLQAQDNGKSVQLLDDLSKQIASMQMAINIKEQDRIDRKTQLFEVLIFVGIIAFSIYALMSSLMDSLMTF